MTEFTMTAFTTRRAALVAGLFALALPWGAMAQLSSPIAGASGVPAGTGAGVHSPNSPFAPLQERNDVVPWSVLTDVKTRVEKNRILPVFPAPVMALNQKSQRIQGFMMPLDPGEKQKHFLLSSVPMSCSFCVPGGPESMVEVKTKTPIKYSLEPVVVEGVFAVLKDDPYGLYYRIVDATPVK
ncbi:MAG: DUF3299 domain-containing protein [Rhodoferax sp.]|nr:DUF3299 domain-containing protein [Rhodoferax sp.]